MKDLSNLKPSKVNTIRQVVAYFTTEIEALKAKQDAGEKVHGNTISAVQRRVVRMMEESGFFPGELVNDGSISFTTYNPKVKEVMRTFQDRVKQRLGK